MSKGKKILIVEDEPLIAEDIRECLQSIHYTVCGICLNKEQAFDSLKECHPDFVILDINLGNNQDGIEIAKHINEMYDIPFIYLTSYSTKSVLEQVKGTHPMGYVVKPFVEADLFSSIEIAFFNHSKLVKPSIFSIELVNGNILEPITNKEFEILDDLYNGKSNTEIAEKHFISINTVKTHAKKIYEKLDTHSRGETIVKIREWLS